jgi:hypothetical protein
MGRACPLCASISDINLFRYCQGVIDLDAEISQIVLKKSFWGDDQNFSGPLMRFARGDIRGHIDSHKNDHGASYERYGVLQWWSRLRIRFCEVFGVVQF